MGKMREGKEKYGGNKPEPVIRKPNIKPAGQKPSKPITVVVGDREYKVKRTKGKELMKWLEENAEIMIQTSEDLIIDIEATEGVEIEHNEIALEEMKKDETRREKSD